jgi:para-nitrobenzyl esterase
MRLVTFAAGLVLAMSATAALAETAAPAAPAAAHYSTANTTIGDLLDDPAAKAIVFKYLPDMAKSDQIDMARGMTLKDTQQYAPDMVSDATLAKIDADLAKLPPKK